MKKKTLLYAPKGYWCLSKQKREEIVNGCGPRGFLGYLVPDKIHGLCITEACNIHDYMYTVGGGIEEKKKADRVFMSNMVALIVEALGDSKKESDLNNAMIRLDLAESYYDKVKRFGSRWFNWHENTPEVMGRLEI